jgi:N-acetylmuramic acid 6-phosphate etherase
MEVDRSKLATEQRLAESMRLDAMSVGEIVSLMNDQDLKAAQAVADVRADVVKAVDLIVQRLARGGRLFYFGAGTSGRLGVLDASECPPTFRTDPSMVQGIIAGGEKAMFVAQEGAEDSPEGGAKDVDARNVGPNDVVCGIAAGGTTPYVHGALRRAKQLGAATLFVTCVAKTPVEADVDVAIRPITGPEVLTGSTRLKAGTATKLVLNQLTTVTMVRLGKCYENLMVDLKASNAKLWDRGARIIATVTGLAKEEAMEYLKRADGHVKVAVVMQKRDIDAPAARALLARHNGQMRAAIES